MGFLHLGITSEFIAEYPCFFVELAGDDPANDMKQV